MTVKEATYIVEDEEQPCFIVSDDEDPTTFMRFAPLYFLIDTTKVIVKEYIGGEYNSTEELDVEWDDMDESLALELTRKLSVYVH